MMNLLPLAKLHEPLPFWDLFEQLRQDGMKLNLDQYQDLQRSIWLGHILTWEDLAAVCAVLWVKPSDGDRQQKLFDRTFQNYQQELIEPEKPETDSIDFNYSGSQAKKLKREVARQFPPLPMRPVSPENLLELGGVKLPRAKRSSINQKWKFYLDDLPLSASDVKESWRAWRHIQQRDRREDLDVGRTVAGMNTGGIIEELFWHPATSQQGDLVVLVDDGDSMLPYWPAVSKLFDIIEQKRITPAQMYRFAEYPWRYLYPWQRPDKSVLAENVLKNLSADRTILLVVSDGGAAMGSEDEDRVAGTLEFLQRWEKSVRPIVWLNPVPIDRWPQTPAAEIQDRLGGRMLSLDQFGGMFMRRLMSSRSWSE
jgi:uncharacterized protein